MRPSQLPQAGRVGCFNGSGGWRCARAQKFLSRQPTKNGDNAPPTLTVRTLAVPRQTALPAGQPRVLSGLAVDGPELFLETLEQIVAVVWSRRGFGVVLDTKRIFAAVTDAGDRLVIQVTVRHFEAIW